MKGLGLGILFEDHVQSELKSGELKIVKVAGLKRIKNSVLARLSLTLRLGENRSPDTGALAAQPGYLLYLSSPPGLRIIFSPKCIIALILDLTAFCERITFRAEVG